MYNILEVANTHAGDIKYIFKLLEEFKEFRKNDGFGIKFQPLKYDKIATSDYEWYKVYVELFFSHEEWESIIVKAFDTKDIWLDIFDDYGIEVLEKNLNNIYGVKLQSSILDNDNIFDKLSRLDLKEVKLILNIAGRSKKEISKLIEKYNEINVNEILLEVGFQAYPTKLEDSGLSKVKFLKESYKNKIVFADHIDGQLEDALILPLIASYIGADIIEKHIMHSTLETKYDHFSSITYPKYKKFIESQNRYISLKDGDFINNAEINYLKTTYQIPILSKHKNKFELLDLNSDIIFRRTNLQGLNINEIKSLINNYYLLNTDKKENDTLMKEDFKKANIAAIIACRLKSTRLPKKALLKIGALTSVELCIKNTLKFNHLNHVILATSTHDQDNELKDYVYNDSVVFHKGEPEDVIKRYISIIDELKIDVIVRITADMPYVSSDVFDYLLERHFQSGADYTVGKDAAIGMNLEIINANALKKIKKYFPTAKYSEYMTWYFQNNPEHFKLNIVDLPSKWIRNYRLTLDYQEDLEMFEKIEEYFSSNNIEYTIEKLYDFLDNNQDITKINSHLTLKYKTDENLIDLLNKETKIK